MSLFPDLSGAVLSPDRRYRYRLWRRLESGYGSLNFILLNPSTADEWEDDPTVARCLVRAQRFGCRELVITNLFALRSPDPETLLQADDPVGPDNDRHVEDAARAACIVVVGWGSFPTFASSRKPVIWQRAERVKALLAAAGVSAFCLRHNQDGQPGHPLYLPYSLHPVPFPLQPRLTMAPEDR